MRDNQARDTWVAVLGELELQVPRSTYETWLKDTVGLDQQSQKLVVGVPNAFTAAWLEERMFPLVQKTVQKISQKPLEVVFQIGTHRNSDPPPPTGQTNGNHTSLQNRDPASPNPKYSFASFVVGPSNDLAYSAAQGVMTTPSLSYNPLFIHSDVGLGKTHLMQA